MPTVPQLTHPAARPDLVSSYRVERRSDPVLFDVITQSIRDDLVRAKVARGGIGHLLREEYTVELASREDAAHLERMNDGRSRASTITEIEMLPEAVGDREEGGGVVVVEKLLVALLGEGGVGVLKQKCGIDGALGGVEEAAGVLKKAREEGKFVVKFE